MRLTTRLAAITALPFLMTSCCDEGCELSVEGAGAGTQETLMASVPVGGSVKVASAAAPADALTQAFNELKAKRVSSFVRAMASDEDLSEMEKSWEEARKTELDPAEDAEFQQFMGMLLAEGAEETLFQMVKPHLAEAQQQVGMLAAMAPMMAAGALQEAGAPDDAMASLQSMAEKLSTIDIGNEDKAKEAIAIVVKMARDMKVKKGSDVQALEFDELLGKVDGLYGAIVDVLAVYELDFTSTFDSIQVKEVSRTGDRAQLEVSVALFGMPAQAIPMEMERVAGRWIPFNEPETAVEAGPGVAR